MSSIDDIRDEFAQSITYTLEQKKVGARVAVTRMAAVDVKADYVLDGLIAQVESYVLAEKLVGDTKEASGSIAFPASPWQFFKQRHAASWWLGWLVRRRPARTVEHPWSTAVRFERYNHYPESTLQVEALGRPVRFEQLIQLRRPEEW